MTVSINLGTSNSMCKEKLCGYEKECRQSQSSLLTDPSDYETDNSPCGVHVLDQLGWEKCRWALGKKQKAMEGGKHSSWS